jgi:hypothetical protein
MEVGENMLFIEDESIGFIESEGQVGRGGQKALGTCLPSYFMLNLSQIFPVVCSIITSICCHNSVKDISTKYEKTISQKVKIEIK